MPTPPVSYGQIPESSKTLLPQKTFPTVGFGRLKKTTLKRFTSPCVLFVIVAVARLTRALEKALRPLFALSWSVA